MKYFIEINKRTIKFNKDAGKSCSIIPDRKEIRFECKKMPNFLKDKENCIITEWCYMPDGQTEFCGYLLDYKLLSRLSKVKEFNIIIEQKYIELFHQPISKYRYSYKNKKVVCDYCKEKINTKDLIEIDLEDYYSPYGCPKCGNAGCVELEYETYN